MHVKGPSDCDDFEEQCRLAQQFYERGDFDGALNSTRQLMEMAESIGQIDKKVNALLLHGTYLAGAGRTGRSFVAALEKCSTLSQEACIWGAYVQSEFLLGMHEMQSFRWVEALARYTRTIELLRENADTMYIDEKVQAISELCSGTEEILRVVRLDASTYSVWLRATKELLRAYADLYRSEDGIKLAENALTKDLNEEDKPSIYELAGMLAMLSGQAKTALSYFAKGLAISERISDHQLGTLSLLQNIARAYRSTGDFSRAISNLERAEANMRQTELRLDTAQFIHVTCLVEIGSIHREMKKPTSARPYLERALKAIDSLPPNATMTLIHKISALTNLGLLDSDEGKYRDAIETQKEALRIYRSGRFSNMLVLAQVETNLAVALSYTDDIGEAISHWKQSLILNQQIGDILRVSRALLWIADLERERQNHAECVAYLQEAFGLRRTAGDLDSCSRILFHIAQEHLVLRDYRLALAEFEEASSLASSLGRFELSAMSLSRCADLYTETHNTGKALLFRQRAVDAWRTVGDSQAVDREELALIELCLDSGHEELLERPMEVLDRLSRSQSLGVSAVTAKARLLQLETRTEGALSALDMLRERLSELDDEERAHFFVNRGILMGELDRFDEAVDSFKAGIALIENISDSEAQGELWKRAGFSYSRMKRPAESYIYLNHALECFRRAGAERKVVEINETLQPLNIKAIMPSLLYTRGLWEYGLSRKSGWTQPKDESADLLSRSKLHGTRLTDNDPDLRAIEEVISVYHAMGVWEDPNLGIFIPIIDFYTRSTGFAGRTLINPLSLTDGCLHFFFFRSDPLGKLAHVLNTCLFVGSGNVIFCSLPFLERLANYLHLGRTGPFSLDEVFRLDTPEAKAYAQATREFDIECNRFLVEWVVAHEIGHAALGHSSSFLTPVPSSSELEQAADDFFMDCYRPFSFLEIPGIKLHMSLSTIILNVYHDCYKKEYGHPFTQSEWVTIDAPIHVTRDNSSPHLPLIVRLLNLVDRVVAYYPKVERTDYFARVRRNITIVEVSNE